MNTAQELAAIFKNTKHTQQDLGKFKMQVFFSGVAFDDKDAIIVFNDHSIARFTDRMDLEKICFEALDITGHKM